MIKKFFLVLLGIILLFGNVFAYSQSELRIAYDKLYAKIEKQSNYNAKTIESVLKKLDTKLLKLAESTKNTKKKTVYLALRGLNTQTLIAKYQNGSVKVPTYIARLQKEWYPFYVLSSKGEFQTANDTYRITFTSYYDITEKNTDQYIKKFVSGWVIVYMNGKYMLAIDSKKERKIPYGELGKFFTFTSNMQSSYEEINGAYVSYIAKNPVVFQDSYWVYLGDLSPNKISLKTTLFYTSGGKYYFSNDFSKVHLIDANIIKNISNKKAFLDAVVDDNRNFPKNYDDIFKQIQQKTLSLTAWSLTKEEKIRKIYDFIIDSTTYYEKYLDGNKQIYSGVLTFKNKTWVCDGYTKLFLYMLSFAGIDDVEIKTGFAFDNKDFPTFGHAWVRIGENYYDPTFDDPIGASRNGKYLYFGIPKDLIYTNRFDGLTIPAYLKNTSLQERKNIVSQNLYNLYDRYKNYPLLQKIKNKKELWFAYDEKITLEKLLKRLPVYEVRDNRFQYNGYEFVLKSYRAYILDNQDIELILSQDTLNLDEVFLLHIKWEYRLAYDVIFE